MSDRNQFSPIQDGLPSELKKQLEKKSEILKQKLIEVFVEGGGTLNVSECLVGWYKIHGEVIPRAKMNSLLHRSKVDGVINSTCNKGEFKVNGRIDL